MIKNLYGITPVTEDQLPCSAYMVSSDYILEVEVRGMVAGWTNHYCSDKIYYAETIIKNIIWQNSFSAKKSRKVGDTLRSFLNRITKNREEAVASLRRRASSNEAYLKKHIQQETEIIDQLYADYARISQQPSTIPCSCSINVLNQTGCQCGGA